METKQVLALALLTATWAQPLAAESVQTEVAASRTPSEAAERYSRWSSFYYLDPKPELTVPAVQSLFDQGTFEKVSARAPLMVFLGELFRQNSEKLPEWMQAWGGISEERKRLLWSALWYADSEESRSLLESAEGQASLEGKAFLGNLRATPPLDLLAEPVSSLAHLDMLWAKFLVSGDRRCVVRIIEVLPWSEEGEGIRREEGAERVDVGNFMIGQAAQWSLGSNAVQHELVFEICREELERQPEEVKVILQEVVEKASAHRKQKGATP